MNLSLIAFSIWLVFLAGLTFLFWLRPKSFFPEYYSSDRVSMHSESTGDLVSVVSSLLAVLLFLSCFYIGVWLAMSDMRGVS